MKQAQAILAMLTDQEAQLRADAEKNGRELDPATAATIARLQETLQQNIQKTREELNRRGLFESGIELELENRLQRGSASDQAMLLGNRLSKLQQDLQAGLSNIHQEQFKTLDQFGLAGANAENAAGELAFKTNAQREQDAVRAMLELRGQQNQFDIAGMHEGGQNTRHEALLRNQVDLAGMREGGENTRQQALLRAEAERQQAQFGFQGGQEDANRQAAAQHEADQLATELRLKTMEINAAAAQGDSNRQAQAEREAAQLANALQIARMNENAASSRQASSEAGANSRNAATIGAENARAAAQRQAEADRQSRQQQFDLANNPKYSTVQQDHAIATFITYPNFQEAGDAVQQNAGRLQNSGVNVDALLDALRGHYNALAGE